MSNLIKISSQEEYDDFKTWLVHGTKDFKKI